MQLETAPAGFVEVMNSSTAETSVRHKAHSTAVCGLALAQVRPDRKLCRAYQCDRVTFELNTGAGI